VVFQQTSIVDLLLYNYHVRRLHFVKKRDRNTVVPCGWGVKAGMVRVWAADKNCVIPLLHAGHI